MNEKIIIELLQKNVSRIYELTGCVNMYADGEKYLSLDHQITPREQVEINVISKITIDMLEAFK